MGNGTVRRCALVLAVLLSAAAVPASAATAGPAGTGTDPVVEPDRPDPLSPQQRAAALAEPAIVAIDVRWEGYVRDRSTGDLLDPEPISATTRCTGAGVGGEGYLLTTANCLRPSAVALDAFGQIVQRRVADGRTPADQAEEQLADLLTNAVIGWPSDQEDPPERSVLVRRAVTADEPMPATVVATCVPCPWWSTAPVVAGVKFFASRICPARSGWVGSTPVSRTATFIPVPS